MVFGSLNIAILFVVGVFGHNSYADQIDSGQAIQIFGPTANQTFELKLETLNEALEQNGIKDREIVVVSVVGATRTGKSFLINIIMKYLYAQYKTHDVLDWLEEGNDGSIRKYLEYKDGTKAHTKGIWMWSEIFTYDSNNGDKLAIVLVDTQGLFDHESDSKLVSTIFALNMMISSVLCYNIKGNVLEDHLTQLKDFTDFARYVEREREASANEKPFQKLLFILRDWQFVKDHNFGHQGGKDYINEEVLKETSAQTHGMKELRADIKESFGQIDGFLMPSPGGKVLSGFSSGKVSDISETFRTSLKELVKVLFHPDMLIVKEVNGKKLKIKEWLDYLQVYAQTFQSASSSQFIEMFKAGEKWFNNNLADKSLKDYVESMKSSLKNHSSYLTDQELDKLHQDNKVKFLEQFEQSPKYGRPERAYPAKEKLDREIEENFNTFKADNLEKKNTFEIKANLINKNLVNNLTTEFENYVTTKVEDTMSELDKSFLDTLATDFLDKKNSILQKVIQSYGAHYTKEFNKTSYYLNSYDFRSE
ncbi:atlastin-like [Contarinia nasturtii]|uniref:atlastin-like n=1 Tax=Contarinia nasturtii TaxID=265458 RepID=UPI0012D388FA|nr:atlastin-like [Contarinia nasturtii]